MRRPLSRAADHSGRRPIGGRGSARTGTGSGGLDVADWAFAGSSIDLDLQNNLFAFNQYPSGTGTSQLTLTRTTAGYAQSTSTGLWTSFASGQFRQTDKGLLIEEVRTNNLLWCRDMTNVAWVLGATMTRALSQTGIDGAANSATLLTGGAVAATNTILQTITLGSAADTYCVFLKRVTGTGTVNISADGTTWTPVTLTTSYQQFQVQQTLANPVCGIQIITASDQVAADFNQLETGAFATSPILTTTVAVARNADVVTFANNALVIASSSAFFQTIGSAGGTLPRFLGLNLDDLLFSSTTQAQASDGTNVATATIGGAGTASGTVKTAFGMNNTSMTAVANGGTKVTQATSVWATNAAGQTAYLAGNSSGNRQLNGYLQRAAFAVPKGIFDNRTS